MNALSRLLTRVAKRVLSNNPTNDQMLETADRVVIWRNAEYLSDEQVEEIASAVPESQDEGVIIQEEAPTEETTDEPDAQEENGNE